MWTPVFPEGEYTEEKARGRYEMYASEKTEVCRVFTVFHSFSFSRKRERERRREREEIEGMGKRKEERRVCIVK